MRTTVWSGATFLAAVVAAFAAVGCSDSRGLVEPTPVSGPAAVRGLPTLGPELAAVRAATAGFHDVGVAVAAGYTDPAGRICDQISAGTMGIHSPNPALMSSQALEPTTPEVLLYLPEPDGGFRLIGVEYVQFVLLRDPSGTVSPWFSSDPWPADYQVVTPTPQLFGQTFDGPMPGHVPGMPWHWDMHVWIWSDNPSGMFAQWNPNPSLSCGN